MRFYRRTESKLNSTQLFMSVLCVSKGSALPNELYRRVFLEVEALRLRPRSPSFHLQGSGQEVAIQRIPGHARHRGV